MFDDWMDLNGDGEVDDTERMLAYEALCTDSEEHKLLFGDDGCLDDDLAEDEEEERNEDLELAGLDRMDLEMMDEDDRIQALEDAGLDVDDYDFD